MKVKQDSDRKRDFIRRELFPLLNTVADDVRYLKIFLYTAATSVNEMMEKRKNEVRIGDLGDELMKMFHSDNPDQDKLVAGYRQLFTLMKDETVNSFQSIIRDLPDNIERYFYTQMEKQPVKSIDIDALLG